MDPERADYADRNLPLPSPVAGCLIVAAASLLTFIGGVGTTVLIVRSIPPKGADQIVIGAGFDSFGWVTVGVVISICAAAVVGVLVSMGMAARRRRDRADQSAE